MTARPLGVHYGGRTLHSGSERVWVDVSLLLGLTLAVVALFALMLTVVLDSAFQVPGARVVEGTLAARTDSAEPYAARPEMRVKPQRP